MIDIYVKEILFVKYYQKHLLLVEQIGIEPTASSVRGMRSPI